MSRDVQSLRGIRRGTVEIWVGEVARAPFVLSGSGDARGSIARRERRLAGRRLVRVSMAVERYVRPSCVQDGPVCVAEQASMSAVAQSVRGLITYWNSKQHTAIHRQTWSECEHN